MQTAALTQLAFLRRDRSALQAMPERLRARLLGAAQAQRFSGQAGLRLAVRDAPHYPRDHAPAHHHCPLPCSCSPATARSRQPVPVAPPPPAASQPAGLGFDPADLDTEIRPQDDFWHHVNGRWLARTEIPADWSSYGTFQILAERTEKQLHALIEADAKSAAPAGTDAQKIGDLYTSFMDESRLEETRPQAAGCRPGKPFRISARMRM